MNLEEIRRFIRECVERMRAISDEAADNTEQRGVLTDAQDAEFRQLDEWADEARKIEGRLEKLERYRDEHPESLEPERPDVNVNVRGSDDPFDTSELRWNAPASEFRARVHKALEGDMPGVSDAQREAIAQTMQRADTPDGRLSRHMLAHASPAYRQAWQKMITGRSWALTPDEARAVDEARAASLTDASGGFTIPTVIDPTIVLTNNGTTNPFRRISRVVQITGDNFNVNSSAGVTASWDGEAAEVSDDAPTLAQTTITPYKAQAFVPFSIEIGQDWPMFEEEMRRMLQDAKDRLEGAAFATGTGTNQPVGIVTALDANTNVEVAMTTGGVFGLVDVYAALEALPPRFRSNATWAMNLVRLNEIRQFGTANNYHGFTVDLTAGGVPAVLGRPVAESSDMASGAYLTTTTTNAIVVGDFRNYVIADRVGMSIELIPHLFATANNLPSGQRGWYAHWRVGADSVNDLGFRLLQNGTT